MSSGPIILGLWSIILQPGATFSQETNPGIQITNISFGEDVKGNDRCVVKIKYPEFEQDSDAEDEDSEDSEGSSDGIKLPKLITKEAVIAILKPNVIEQVSVNITLVEDVEVVEFTVTGPNAVHIVGHYCQQEDFDQEPYSDSEGEGYDSNDESIDSELEGYSMEGMSGMLGEEDDEEDSEAERFVELKEEKKAAASKKRAADVDESMEVGDESISSTLSKNQRKKLAKKMKSTDGSAVEVEAPVVAKKAAVVAPVAAPVVAAAKKEVKKEEPKVEKKAAAKSQTLAGGLVITDSKVGEGAAAKSGKKVSMRYIGKLDSGKIFDSNTKGSPLHFTLGRGEVIKGWDQGIIGMKVGGERKLAIPSELAYGKKGTQGIPGGATLHFDVKLIAIK